MSISAQPEPWELGRKKVTRKKEIWRGEMALRKDKENGKKKKKKADDPKKA